VTDKATASRPPVVLIAALFAASLGLAYASRLGEPRSAPIAVDAPAERAVDQTIHRSAQYLVRHCDADGRFTYRLHLTPSRTAAPKYNALRHAGAIYALSMAHEEEADEAVLATMIRASSYLSSRFVGPVPGEPDLAAVWSYVELTNQEPPDIAKLGGAGLTLIALTQVERAAPGTTKLDTLQRIGRFVLWMQKEDGSFYSKLDPARGRDDRWTSLYYPGEAALGLMLLHRLDPDPAWAKGAGKALAHLERTRRGQTVVPPDHWALLATGALLPIVERETPERQEQELGVTADALTSHAAQIAESMLSESRPPADHAELGGSFTDDGRTTPTATRMEGLIAAHGYLPDQHDSLRREIAAQAHASIGFLLRAHVAGGKHAGAMPRAIAEIEGSDEETNRFNFRADEVRIDYVQHALSACIQYRRTWGISTQSGT